MADQIIQTGQHVVDRRRVQEVATGEYAPEVYARTAWDAAVALGRAYIHDTGRLTLAVAGNLRVLLANPTDSGVVMTIHGASGLSTATGWARLRLNPTTGLPSGAQVPMRMNRSSGVAAVTTIDADTSATTALAGGTDTGVDVGFAANAARSIGPLGIVLAPAQSLGVNVVFAGSADIAVGFFVTEEPV